MYSSCPNYLDPSHVGMYKYNIINYIMLYALSIYIYRMIHHDMLTPIFYLCSCLRVGIFKYILENKFFKFVGIAQGVFCGNENFNFYCKL